MTKRRLNAERVTVLPQGLPAAPTPADLEAGTTARHAHRFAKYSGDCAASLLADPVHGPNANGEALVVVFAHYDPVEDVTRAGFTFATLADISAQLDRELAAAAAAWGDGR